jgi:ABC-2 type transport system ATP-binding protein
LLDEVEKTADAVAIVDQGRIVVQGPVAQIAAGGDPALLVEVDDAAAARRVLGTIPDVRSVADDGAALRVTLAAGFNAAAVNRVLVAAGVAVSRLEPARVSLEERFLNVTSRLEVNR